MLNLTIIGINLEINVDVEVFYSHLLWTIGIGFKNAKFPVFKAHTQLYFLKRTSASNIGNFRKPIMDVNSLWLRLSNHLFTFI